MNTSSEEMDVIFFILVTCEDCNICYRSRRNWDLSQFRIERGSATVADNWETDLSGSMMYAFYGFYLMWEKKALIAAIGYISCVPTLS